MNYFVTAIGTDSGKTLVSAILVKALQCDYWKPIQSGLPRDSETVEKLIDNTHSFIHPEAYLLKTPASPHYSAALDKVTIDLEKINLPATDGNDLVIEGAGGVLVPLNDTDVVIDLAARFKAEIILVSNHYLGSINHTLLTIEALKKRNLPVKGIIFNGIPNPSSEEIILKKSGYPCLLRIAQEEKINEETVMRYALKLVETWFA
ncbi:MAG: dethiobiotin synthase [Cytophagaceae bacterium]|jgi:dethiobiotin synthetase|nr:dethiobiotin synthase [Cytophagaceae bacterium]